MSTPCIEDGIRRLRTRWPQAHAEQGYHGKHLIIVPSVMLPTQYDKTICTVLFIAPPGYPSACPENFFTDIDIGLTSRNRGDDQPKNTLKWSAVHGGNFHGNHWGPWKQWERCMWWSWHLQAWNPNRDDLYTYMRVIERRFAVSENAIAA